MDDLTAGTGFLVGFLLGTAWTVAVFRATRRTLDAHVRDALALFRDTPDPGREWTGRDDPG